jgi:uncharacterized protein YbjT (DUF2867 family)
MKKIILVTGATGKQGGAVVRHLLGQGFAVRALTRDPGKLNAIALSAKGVEVVKGDMEDRASLRRAMTDVYGVFSVQNYWEKNVGYDGEIRQARNLAQAAKDAGVSHFVQSSIANCDNAKGVKHAESKWEIEKLVASLGLPHTFIRTVFFMDNFFIPKVGAMTFPMLSGGLHRKTRFHLLAADDIGWFVTTAFTQPEKYLGQTLEIAGDSLTVQEMKQVYYKVMGKRPSGLKFPAWLLGLMNREFLEQLRWNNRVPWDFSIQKLRVLHPRLSSFESFLKTQKGW